MKLLLLLVLLATASAQANEVTDFNQLLMNDVQKDIVKDDEKFRKAGLSRGPASVEEGPAIKEESKIDKNVRQIGPRSW